MHKIEGYQQLTNKLQRHLNQKLLTEIGDIGTRCDTIAANLGDTDILARFEGLEQSHLQLQQEHQRLQERLSVLEGLSSKFSAVQPTDTPLKPMRHSLLRVSASKVTSDSNGHHSGMRVRSA